MSLGAELFDIIDYCDYLTLSRLSQVTKHFNSLMNSKYYLNKITQTLQITNNCNNLQDVLTSNIKNIKDDYIRCLLELRIDGTYSHMLRLLKIRGWAIHNQYVSIDLINNECYIMWLKLCKEAIKLNKCDVVDYLQPHLFNICNAYKNNYKCEQQDWNFDYLKEIINCCCQYNIKMLGYVIERICNWHLMIYCTDDYWINIFTKMLTDIIQLHNNNEIKNIINNEIINYKFAKIT